MAADSGSGPAGARPGAWGGGGRPRRRAAATETATETATAAAAAAEAEAARLSSGLRPGSTFRSRRWRRSRARRRRPWEGWRKGKVLPLLRLLRLRNPPRRPWSAAAGKDARERRRAAGGTGGGTAAGPRSRSGTALSAFGVSGERDWFCGPERNAPDGSGVGRGEGAGGRDESSLPPFYIMCVSVLAGTIGRKQHVRVLYYNTDSLTPGGAARSYLRACTPLIINRDTPLIINRDVTSKCRYNGKRNCSVGAVCMRSGPRSPRAGPAK